jgi:hypothetical protein
LFLCLGLCLFLCSKLVTIFLKVRIVRIDWGRDILLRYLLKLLPYLVCMLMIWHTTNSFRTCLNFLFACKPNYYFWQKELCFLHCMLFVASILTLYAFSTCMSISYSWSWFLNCHSFRTCIAYGLAFSPKPCVFYHKYYCLSFLI